MSDDEETQTPVWREVTQTILAGRDDGVYGNCLQAAVASVLDLPLDAVPHFSQFLWWSSALELWARGLRGGRWDGLHYHEAPTSEIPDRLCIVSGKSERGVEHCVVGYQGRVVWDPHPSGAGLVTVTSAGWFDPLGDEARRCILCGIDSSDRAALAGFGGRS